MIQNTTPDQERYGRAKQRVELVRGFYGHAIVFVLVNIGLAASRTSAARSARAP